MCQHCRTGNRDSWGLVIWHCLYCFVFPCCCQTSIFFSFYILQTGGFLFLFMIWSSTKYESIRFQSGSDRASWKLFWFSPPLLLSSIYLTVFTSIHPCMMTSAFLLWLFCTSMYYQIHSIMLHLNITIHWWCKNCIRASTIPDNAISKSACGGKQLV